MEGIESRSSRWLSLDFTALLESQLLRPEPYDVVVVGSGYGGSMAAAELAQCIVPDGAGGRPARICVLERGKEYLPGSFPSTLRDLPGHVRFHRQGRKEIVGSAEGLLDLRASKEGAVLVGSGLGGGSLINAGVLEEPKWGELAPVLPVDLVHALSSGLIDEVRERLGGGEKGKRNDIYTHPLAPRGTSKTQLMEMIGGSRFRPAAISVAMRDGRNAAGVELKQCVLCGDCLTGCNAGAKQSLDTNLLVQAKRKGADIYTGASVVKLSRQGAEWLVHVVYTNPALRERHEVLRLRAAKVILAAGALGSTEILLRSSGPGLAFSPRLGSGFSGNGDTALLGHKLATAANSAPSPEQPPWERHVGPTITGVVDLRSGASGRSFLLQELTVPAALRRVFEEIITSASLLESIGSSDAGRATLDPYAVEHGDIQNSVLLGVVGHDESNGTLTLDTSAEAPEGAVHVSRAPDLGPDGAASALDRAASVLRQSSAFGSESVLCPNPFWRGLPESLTLRAPRMDGPMVTVHPLGGCPMGADASSGVVDSMGRVFDPASGKTHDGLVVLDGSVLPCSLAANPALTIAAIACRSARTLRSEWGWTDGKAERGLLRSRPPVRSLTQTWRPQAPTMAQIAERMVGEVKLADRVLVAEMTLYYAPFEVRSLFGFHTELRTRAGQPGEPASALRLFDKELWTKERLETAGDGKRERLSMFRGKVQATLRLEREPSRPWQRVRRALPAWLRNRGLADLFSGPGTFARRPLKSVRWMWNVASRAGEVRRLVYSVTVESVGEGSEALLQPGDLIAGAKLFSYTRRANPLRQLTELQLDQFPNATGSANRLRVDGRFMARVPFIQLAAPQDFTVALADFGALAAYLARVAAGIHLWSFRYPGATAAATPNRLPRALPGLPEPEIHELEVAPPVGGIPVLVRLTRYGRSPQDRTGPPLLMIHGYSASGTTFAHPAIRVPMAAFFWKQHRDVWVVDLRTSAGLPSATLPWRFEDAAFQDIPAAIARIRECTGAEQVDVFAHCIGAVMLSMALLAPDHVVQKEGRSLGDLPGRIRRIVLSQKAPVLVYSEGNQLRAYLYSRLRALLPEDFQFDSVPGAANDRIVDRLLTGLMPYPDEDYDRETAPLRSRKAAWAGFRRRMDALYSRDFTLRDIPDETLAAITELFGPLNLDTVSQAMHFVERGVITDGSGNNVYVTAERLRQRWKAEATLSVHGAENGLVSAATAFETARVMQCAGVPMRTKVFEGFGHQDLLIGTEAHRMFSEVEAFLR